MSAYSNYSPYRCHQKPRPKPVCVENCKEERPFHVYGSGGCFGVKNCEEGVALDVGGTLTTEVKNKDGVALDVNATLCNKDGQRLMVDTLIDPDSSMCVKLENKDEKPLAVTGDLCVCANVHGHMHVENGECPFEVAGCVHANVNGCLQVEPKSEDGFKVTGKVDTKITADSCVPVSNKDDEAFKITGGVGVSGCIGADVSGCLSITNCCDEDFHICGNVGATVDGCLQVEPKCDDGFKVAGEVNIGGGCLSIENKLDDMFRVDAQVEGCINVHNCEEDPLFVDANVCAHVEGCINVHNDKDDPLFVDVSGSINTNATVGGCLQVFNDGCEKTLHIDNGSEPLMVEGCLGIENAGCDSFCVALENKDAKPLEVGGDIKIGWNKECSDAVPVFGQLEICNCCDQSLKVDMPTLDKVLETLVEILKKLTP